jgi:hypothetical protein
MAQDAGMMDFLGGGGDAGGGRSAAGPNEIQGDEDRKKKMLQALAGGLSGAAQGGGGGMSIAPIPQPAQMQAAQSSFQMPQNLIGDARYEALSRLAR